MAKKPKLLSDLFHDTLKDVYFAENKILKTLPKMAKAAQSKDLKAAFVKHDGYQCGYCTPGQICSAVAMLDEIKRGVPSHVSADLMARPAMTAVEFRERMSGNICRCAAYSNIVDAISEVAGSST